MSNTTLLWHDYETWGLDPRRDRPSQFAAIRTDTDLNPIGEPINILCKPALDFIPHPESALITGLTPQVAQEKGIIEAEFAKVIESEFSQPGTCGVGYNSIRFDDEVTRFHLYRNFYDPYAREWQNGNSRWDIVDLVRMCYALRPDGITWPEREPGIPSFRLEDLSKANNIDHGNAHDALSDVHATLGLAQLIKQKQPKLYDYYFSLRRKNEAAKQLNLVDKTAIVHVSGMYPSTIGCIAPVMPLCTHPRNKNEIIVFDLRQNPFHLFNLGAEEIRKTLFTKKADLPEGAERVAIKGLHLNKSPAIAPLNTLSSEMADKWEIDLKKVMANRERILYFDGLESKIHQIYKPDNLPSLDADSALYQGFITRNERILCDNILKSSMQERLTNTPAFQDPRLQTLYSRYLGRNWPESLSDVQTNDWQQYRVEKLIDGEHGGHFTLDDFHSSLKEVESSNDHEKEILRQLSRWVDEHFTLLSASD